MKKTSQLTLANKITIGRILLIPVIVITLLHHLRDWVAVLLILSMVTDFLDGMTARLRGERTKLGAFLDPMADKLLMTAVYMTLTGMGILETWIFVVIFSRDLLIVLGWVVIYILTGSSAINPRKLGKVTTFVQMVTALTFIWRIPLDFQQVLIWLTIGLTIGSAIDYIVVGQRRLGEWG